MTYLRHPNRPKDRLEMTVVLGRMTPAQQDAYVRRVLAKEMPTLDDLVNLELELLDRANLVAALGEVRNLRAEGAANQ